MAGISSTVSHVITNAVVESEIKLKQNKRKTMFYFSENVLFQFYFRCNHCLSSKNVLTLHASVL